MEKEAVLVVQIVGNESQGIANAIGDFGRLSVAAMICDAETGQAEPRGGDARHRVRVIAIRESAIFYLPGLGAGLIPKKLKAGALDFIEELLVGSLKWRAIRLNERGRRALLATGKRSQGRGQEAH